MNIRERILAERAKLDKENQIHSQINELSALREAIREEYRKALSVYQEVHSLSIKGNDLALEMCVLQHAKMEESNSKLIELHEQIYSLEQSLYTL